MVVLLCSVPISYVQNLMFHVPRRELDVVKYRTTLGHKTNDRVKKLVKLILHVMH